MTKFYEGQEVECLVFNEGTILHIGLNDKIVVRFGNDEQVYTDQGELILLGQPKPNRTLYPAGTVRVVVNEQLVGTCDEPGGAE